MVSKDDLQNWRTLNAALKECTEEECAKLLQMEQDEQARAQFLNRIHGTFNKRRYARERIELARVAKNP